MYRIPVSPREKVAFIQLRQRGYCINHIAKAFGRSTSVIHKVLKKAWELHCGYHRDERKIPRRIRELHAQISPKNLRKYLKLWESFILSEEGKPP